jgi:stage V sporulation protein B
LSKKDSLIKGTIILTVAALVARFLGLFQRIPLVYLLGNEGMASYTIAFNLYSTLLIIATAGVPTALSKMISEKMAVGHYQDARKIYRASLWFAVIAGIVMAVMLYILAPFYAEDISRDPHAVLATQAIAPALLLFPLIAIMRGYFQGRQRMMPNGISQVVEQILRLVVGVLLAYLLLNVSLEWGIAGASLGGVAGGVAALAVMIYYAVKIRQEDKEELPSIAVQRSDGSISHTKEAGLSDPGITLSYGSILKDLLRLSIPIVIFSMTVTLIYNIDSSTVIPFLTRFTDTPYQEAKELLGILGGQAQSLAGLPIVLAVALSQSIMPIISAAYSQGKMDIVANQTAKVLQLSIISGLPMVLLICTGSRPIDGFIFLFGGSEIGNQFAPSIIALMTASVMFQIIMQTSGAVLMGMGKMQELVQIVAIGIGTKMVSSILLVKYMGIYGIIAGSALCFVIMSYLNLRVLHKEVKFRIMLKRRWVGLAFSTVIIVAVGMMLEIVTDIYLHPTPWVRFNYGLNAVIVCGAVMALYPTMLMVTRVVTWNDVPSFPAPLQKLIHKAARILKRS